MRFLLSTAFILFEWLTKHGVQCPLMHAQKLTHMTIVRNGIVEHAGPLQIISNIQYKCSGCISNLCMCGVCFCIHSIPDMEGGGFPSVGRSSTSSPSFLPPSLLHRSFFFSSLLRKKSWGKFGSFFYLPSFYPPLYENIPYNFAFLLTRTRCKKFPPYGHVKNVNGDTLFADEGLLANSSRVS